MHRMFPAWCGLDAEQVSRVPVHFSWKLANWLMCCRKGGVVLGQVAYDIAGCRWWSLLPHLKLSFPTNRVSARPTPETWLLGWIRAFFAWNQALPKATVLRCLTGSPVSGIVLADVHLTATLAQDTIVAIQSFRCRASLKKRFQFIAGSCRGSTSRRSKFGFTFRNAHCATHLAAGPGRGSQGVTQ
jgi:hypothetical protein